MALLVYSVLDLIQVVFQVETKDLCQAVALHDSVSRCAQWAGDIVEQVLGIGVGNFLLSLL
jgi:hypothetical protein